MGVGIEIKSYSNLCMLELKVARQVNRPYSVGVATPCSPERAPDTMVLPRTSLWKVREPQKRDILRHTHDQPKSSG
jgi:hypothetical protein